MGNPIADMFAELAETTAPIRVTFQPESPLSTVDFERLCVQFRDLRLEQAADGEIVFMAPAGGETGGRNMELSAQLRNWARRDRTGRSFASSTGFVLPNGSSRAPDASWVRLERLTSLSAKEKRGFLPLCPDFVVELRCLQIGWRTSV